MIIDYTAPLPMKPQWDKLVFDRDRCIGPLDVLYELPDEGSALFSQAVLAQKDSLWTLRHNTQAKYPRVAMLAPSTWVLQRYGQFHTSLGIRPIKKCVGPHLSHLSDFLPVATISVEGAELVQLRNKAEEITPDEWNEALEFARHVADAAKLGSLYGTAALFRPAPDQLYCRVGDSFEHRSAEQITVATSDQQIEILARRHLPVLLADAGSAEVLCSRWNLVSAQVAIQKEVQVGDPSPAVPVLDRFPGLFGMLPRDIGLVACSSLLVDVVTDAGKRSDPVDFYLDGSTAYYTEGTLRSRSTGLSLS
jgi:hypothetical protein